jgi:DNA repair protein RecO (recombination protein O)
MSEASKARLDAQPAYVLHSYPYRETSLILDVFSQNHGRVALIARGARRPRSALRGVLLAFQPLLLSWAGKSELRTLHKAEWQGGLPQLKGTALLCGFYLNELMVKLLPRDDPHEALYGAYAETLRALNSQPDAAAWLRRFEKKLLKELGYALTLDHDVATGEPIVAAYSYRYVVEHGPVCSADEARAESRTGAAFATGGVSEKQLELAGLTLLDMGNDDYSNPVTMQQSKALMRMLINHYLGEQTLNTRQLLKDLHQL